jgi:hypothetical protein
MKWLWSDTDGKRALRLHTSLDYQDICAKTILAVLIHRFMLKMSLIESELLWVPPLWLLQ